MKLARKLVSNHLCLCSSLALIGTWASIAQAQCDEGCVAIHTLTGENSGDFFGYVSENTGDIDKDGVDDFIISSPFFGSNVGRLYVYCGATGELLFEPITGTLTGYRLGNSVGAAGDVNNDGTIDVIAGAPSNGNGRAYVYSGIDGSLLRTFIGQASFDQFGSAVAGIGDIDSDGFADLAVTATSHDGNGNDSGRIYIYSGLDSSIMGTADGESAFDFFGSGISLLGDVDKDNINDFVVGAPNAGPGTGRAYVYSGASFLQPGPISPLYALIPPGAASAFALFFLDGGDMNGDGTPDIYISDFSINRAHVFSGIDGAWMRTFFGTGGFGIGRFVGDANGDGKEELILASWFHPGGGTQAGRADIFDGDTGAILDTFTHNVPFAQFGYDANGMRDVDGDGKIDYLVTAANDLNSTGKAYLIKGNIGPPLPPGDLDGDGFVGTNDLLILLSSWGNCPDCFDPSSCPADFNEDCEVSTSDVLFLLSNWG